MSDVVADFADLVQKEMKLARAEIAEKLSNKLRAGVWLSAAAALAFLTVALLAPGVGALDRHHGNFPRRWPASSWRVDWPRWQGSHTRPAAPMPPKASHRIGRYTKLIETSKRLRSV